MWNNIEFAQPMFLILLAVIPLLLVYYWSQHSKQNTSIRLSTTSPFAGMKKNWKLYFLHAPFALRMLALTLLIIAFARPQSSSKQQNVNIKGIDMIMALDISSSMLAEDFKPNRLEAAKDVAWNFIKGRKNDRAGLVIFAGESFTQCPLTSDHSVLKNLFKDIKSGMIDDGTAIGDGLATAINRLKKSKAVSKIIILLTDGENNSGALDPTSAAEIAEMYGIRVYTIGVGTHGTAPYPVSSFFGKQYQQVEVKIDEELLQNIADMTGGKYFRATDNDKLKQIYQEIDTLEKSKIDVIEFTEKSEQFLSLALLAFALLTLEFLLRNTILKTLL
ncbi:MAG: VWA domain-containing protein [Bacteroidota bacterium]|nr:VWA domain-containing protein [Bacteroidota bacterium]